MRLYDFETHFEAEMALMSSDDDNNPYNIGSSLLFRHQTESDEQHADTADTPDTEPSSFDNISTQTDKLSSTDISAFKRYTQEIGQFSLLDAEQEKSFAGQIADGFLGLQRLLARDPRGREALISALSVDKSPASDGDEKQHPDDGGATLLQEALQVYYQLSHNTDADSTALARAEQVLSQCLEQHDVPRDLLLDITDRFLAAATRHDDASMRKNLDKTRRRILRARDRLIEGNLRLVIYIARRFKDRGVDSEDLIQEGNLGLMRAAIKFDASAGVRFSTYGFWWITQAMRQCITRNRSLIRYPNHVAEQVNRIARITQQHRMAHGELPAAPQLAKEARLSRHRLNDLLSLSNICVSLSRPLSDDGHLQLEDTLGDDERWAKPVDQAWLSEQNEWLDRLLGQLEERDATIIRLKFGVGHRKEYSLREIADQLGISKERVRQIVDRSTTWLRTHHPSLMDSFRSDERALPASERTAEA